MADPHETPSPSPPIPASEHTKLPGSGTVTGPDSQSSPWFVSGGAEAAGSPAVPPAAGTHPEPAADPVPGEVVATRYSLRRRVGHGGMAVVYAAVDTTLDRNVAVKVVRHDARVRPDDRHRVYADLAVRFTQEARITCQLQHPGIPPVHEVGQFPDGRPFMVMKLIKGNTLADMLKSRSATAAAADLPEYLQHFEKICQTVEYAHSKGVVHRDLDPRNVMVGAFGEVQVMDWGLAMALADRPAPEPGLVEEAIEGTIIVPVRGTAPVSAEGTVGKFWYMPPEQAAGVGVDRRADVFALGAILCEILTGKPPYTGRTVLEARLEAQLWQTEAAFGRLDACGADPELIALVKRCLGRRPDDRPADAAAVAQEVGNYRAGVASRLRQAELDRTAAEARADAEGLAKVAAEQRAAAEERARLAAVAAAEYQRSRRRAQLGFVVAAAAVVVVVTGGLWWLDHKEYGAKIAAEKAAGDRIIADERERVRAEAEREAATALKEAQLKLEEAAGLTADPQRWSAALHEARAYASRARETLERMAAAGTAPAGPIDRDLAAFEATLDQVEKDRTLVARLEEIADGAGLPQAHREALRTRSYLAFRDYGLDPFDPDLPPPACGDRVCKNRHKEVILLALFDLMELLPGSVTFDSKKVELDTRRLEDVIGHVLGRDTVFTRWRAVRNTPEKVPALLASLNPAVLHPREIGYLVVQLRSIDLDGPALELLRRGIAQHPRDFRLQLQFTEDVNRLPAAAVPEAADHATVAITLRPRSASAHRFLGDAQFRLRRFEEAARSYRRALELATGDPIVLANLGGTLLEKAKADPAGSADLLDAVYYLWLAAQRDPDDYRIWHALGTAEFLAGDLASAEICFENATTADHPLNWAGGLVGLGQVRFARKQFPEAEAAFTEAAAIDPRSDGAHFGLGREAHRLKKFADAQKEFLKALDAAPDHWEAWFYRGDCLWRLSRPEQALACFRKAAELNPRNLDVLDALLRALAGKELHAETARAYAALDAAAPDRVRLLVWAESGAGVGAARAALLAGLGHGSDLATPDEQRQFRRLALAWLRIDLMLWAEKLARNPEGADLVARKLNAWLTDATFDPSRGVAAAVALPEEPADWQAFWDEVRHLHDRADRIARGKP